MDPVDSGTIAEAPTLMDPLLHLFPPCLVTCMTPGRIDPGIGIERGCEQGSEDDTDQYVAIGKRDAARKARKRRQQINRKIRRAERSYIRAGAQETPASDVPSPTSQPSQPTAFLYPGGRNWECQFCLCLIPKHTKQQHITSPAHISVIDSIFLNDHPAGTPLNAIIAQAGLPADPRLLTQLRDMSHWLQIYSCDLIEQEAILHDVSRIEELSFSLDAEFNRLIDIGRVDMPSSRPASDSGVENHQHQRSREPSSAMRAVLAAKSQIAARLTAKQLRESSVRENVVRRQSVSLARAFPPLAGRMADPRMADPRGRGGKC